MILNVEFIVMTMRLDIPPYPASTYGCIEPAVNYYSDLQVSCHFEGHAVAVIGAALGQISKQIKRVSTHNEYNKHILEMDNEDRRERISKMKFQL